MATTNTVVQQISNDDYRNEHFRSKHGYKEIHVHDPPQRRSRDFKPVPYGSFKGMLNFRLAEPYCHLKNLANISAEHHNFVIRWVKTACEGAAFGAIYGYIWFTFKPENGFVTRKMENAAG